MQKNKEGHFLLVSQSDIPIIAYGAKRNSRIEEAAKLLQNVIEEITEITIPLYREDELETLPKANRILVGPSRFTRELGIFCDDLKAQSIKIIQKENFIAILGPPPGKELLEMARETNYVSKNTMILDEVADGTFYAALYFIKNFLNVDFLFPGELGRAFERKSEIWMPENLDINFTPKLLFRRIRNGFSARGRNAEGLEKLGVDPRMLRDRESLSREWFKTQCLGFGADVRFTHNFSDWWTRHGKEHPEWFALRPPVKEKGETEPTRDQSLDNSDRARFCMSNPMLIEQIISEIIEYFKKNPWASSYSISLNDGGVYNTFCTCDKCAEMDSEGAQEVKMPYGSMKSLSDRVFSFYSQIAEGVGKVFPDKLLGTYAYSAYRKPPVKMTKIPENLMVGLVCLQYENDEKREEARKEIDEWSKICRHFFVRPNALNAYLGFPAFYARKLAEDVRFSMDRGCIGFDWDCNHGNWAVNGINLWILAQVMWDASQDVDCLLERYCKLGFGKAWKPVREYFCMTEKIADSFAESKKWVNWMSSVSDLAAAYTDEWLTNAESVLMEALETADETTVKRRIEFLLQGIETSKIRKVYFLETANRAIDETADKDIEIEHLDGTQVQVFKSVNKRACEQREKHYLGLVDSFAFNIGALNWRNL